MSWLKEMFILPGGIGRRLLRVRWSTVAEGALGGPILPKVLCWVGVLLGSGLMLLGPQTETSQGGRSLSEYLSQRVHVDQELGT